MKTTLTRLSALVKALAQVHGKGTNSLVPCNFYLAFTTFSSPWGIWGEHFETECITTKNNQWFPQFPPHAVRHVI
jgi:hypothetical protein